MIMLIVDDKMFSDKTFNARWNIAIRENKGILLDDQKLSLAAKRFGDIILLYNNIEECVVTINTTNKKIYVIGRKEDNLLYAAEI
jgi:hypothetical protein